MIMNDEAIALREAEYEMLPECTKCNVTGIEQSDYTPTYQELADAVPRPCYACNGTVKDQSSAEYCMWYAQWYD